MTDDDAYDDYRERTAERYDWPSERLHSELLRDLERLPLLTDEEPTDD
jgi:hypothetical protein